MTPLDVAPLCLIWVPFGLMLLFNEQIKDLWERYQGWKWDKRLINCDCSNCLTKEEQR